MKLKFLLTLIPMLSFGAHQVGTKVQATDIVDPRGNSIQKFPTTAPTPSRATQINADGETTSSNVTTTELSYLSGVTSAIQTQLNAKQGSLPSGTNTDYLRGDFTFQTLNTSVVPEGSNLYWTASRFNTAFSGKSTTDLSEGSNLYYTAARFNAALASKSTSDLVEGSNLYYLDSRARAAISGSNPILYNASTGVFSCAVGSGAQPGCLSSNDWNTFNGKENALTAGTTAQYYRGDKSWQTLDTSAVPENVNLYYTDTRARLALSATTPITYNNSTGAISVADGAIANAKLGNMNNNTIKGNVSGGTAAPSDLTGTQVTSILTNFVGDSGSGGTKGLVPAPASGDAAAGKFLKADGTWTAAGGLPAMSSSTNAQVLGNNGSAASWVWPNPTFKTVNDASFPYTASSADLQYGGFYLVRTSGITNGTFTFPTCDATYDNKVWTLWYSGNVGSRVNVLGLATNQKTLQRNSENMTFKCDNGAWLPIAEANVFPSFHAVSTNTNIAEYMKNVYVTVGSSTITATLPDATASSTKNYEVTVMQVDGGSGQVSIATTSSQTINAQAASNWVIKGRYQYLTFKSDGANWIVKDDGRRLIRGASLTELYAPDGSHGIYMGNTATYIPNTLFVQLGFGWATGGASTTSTLTQNSEGTIAANAASGNITLTLPGTTDGPMVFHIYKSDSSTNTVSIGTTINGVASPIVLYNQYDSVFIIRDSSGAGKVIADNRGAVTTTITTNTTAAAAGKEVTYLCNATSGAVTLTGYAAAQHKGYKIKFKKTDSSGNNCVFDPNASELVDGASTDTLSTQNASKIYESDGTGWFIF